MGITPGMIIGGLGAAGGLAGLFGGGGAGNVQRPPMFNMPYMNEAAGGAFGGISNMGQYANMGYGAMPYAQNTFQNLYNNPYAGGAMGGAQFGGGMGQQGAINSFNVGGGLESAGMGTIPYAQAIMNQGFDPQNALYNRTQQQLQDQTRASQAARGISTSPYGANLENQAMGDFNINWQNNLLGREATAAGAAGGLLRTGAGLVGEGAGLQNAAGGQYAAASAMPYNTFEGIGRGQNQDLSSMLGLAGQGQGLAQTQIGDWLSYLQTGNQAGGVANQNFQYGLNQQNQQFQQNQQYGNMLGYGLYGLGQQPWGGVGGGGWFGQGGGTGGVQSGWSGPMPGSQQYPGSSPNQWPVGAWGS